MATITVARVALLAIVCLLAFQCVSAITEANEGVSDVDVDVDVDVEQQVNAEHAVEQTAENEISVDAESNAELENHPHHHHHKRPHHDVHHVVHHKRHHKKHHHGKKHHHKKHVHPAKKHKAKKQVSKVAPGQAQFIGLREDDRIHSSHVDCLKTRLSKRTENGCVAIHEGEHFHHNVRHLNKAGVCAHAVLSPDVVQPNAAHHLIHSIERHHLNVSFVWIDLTAATGWSPHHKQNRKHLRRVVEDLHTAYHGRIGIYGNKRSWHRIAGEFHLPHARLHKLPFWLSRRVEHEPELKELTFTAKELRARRAHRAHHEHHAVAGHHSKHHGHHAKRHGHHAKHHAHKSHKAHHKQLRVTFSQRLHPSWPVYVKPHNSTRHHRHHHKHHHKLHKLHHESHDGHLHFINLNKNHNREVCGVQVRIGYGGLTDPTIKKQVAAPAAPAAHVAPAPAPASAPKVGAAVASVSWTKLSGKKINGVTIPAAVLNDLSTNAAAYGVTTPLRAAHFLAQCMTESGGFRTTSENLSYSLASIQKTFAKNRYVKGKTAAQLAPYVKNPVKLGNLVYQLGNGNGNEASGDGYKYRGHGYIQLTGKATFAAYSKYKNNPSILSNPDLLLSSPYTLDSALWFFTHFKSGLLAKADQGATTAIVDSISKVVNGGTNGLPARRAYFAAAYALLK